MVRLTSVLSRLADCFQFDGRFLCAEPVRGGHIHDSFALWFERPGEPPHRYFVQRINQAVFGDSRRLMGNIQLVTTHLRKKIAADGGDPQRETLTLIPTHQGQPYWAASTGESWRALVFIEGAQTYPRVQQLQQVAPAAAVLGRFQAHLADFPASRLHPTIPNFHHSPQRLKLLLKALELDPLDRTRYAASEIGFVKRRAHHLFRLVDLLEQGDLPLRVTHNDTKFDNVMIDHRTGRGLCLVDLDTVMPGLALYDFGDAVRSWTNASAEDEPDPSRVVFDLDIYRELVRGYLDTAGGFLTEVELGLLSFSGRLLTLECGIRFLTDYLQGDGYFKVSRVDHNLDRCRVQLELVRQMEAQADDMQAIVERYCQGAGLSLRSGSPRGGFPRTG